ncbi:MAG: hypothetical protein U0231_05770 [Nitrospiraceae bacterium]
MHTKLLIALSVAAIVVVGSGIVESVSAAPKQQKPKSAKHETSAAQVALQYAEAISKGDRVQAGQLDFACQYRLVVAASGPVKHFAPPSDASYEACWAPLAAAHAPALRRTDIAMDVIWPSTGPLVFFGDELPRAPASAFVMDALGISPPGTGLHLTAVETRPIPGGSFRLKTGGKVLGTTANLVLLKVEYQDPLTSPLTYAPGLAKWTNTIKRPRLAVKSVTTQWVVFSGLKKHGFPGDTAVFNLPLPSQAEAPGMTVEKIPFATETSRALPETIAWWQPDDQPGTLTAAAARAATYPELRDRVALLNRILLIDPKQPDALTVLTRNLYTVILREGRKGHQLNVKDPALALVLDEFYWNIYAESERLDLSNGMEMGGLPEPTPADFLYRMLPALQTLVSVRPQQLDYRFQLGVAYRWNNDQVPMIQTFESLVRDIPENRKTPKAEAQLQLAWSRITKVAWNRILHDPESERAYADAEASLANAELPLDKFLAEYTMAYSMIFMPNYGDKAKMLHHLTEAKRWFDQVPGKSDEVWRYFMQANLLKPIMDADPSFSPLLAATPAPAPASN